MTVIIVVIVVIVIPSVLTVENLGVISNENLERSFATNYFAKR